MSKEWEYSCEESQIRLKCTATESHSSPGIGEKHHSTLRTKSSKVICYQPNLPDDLVLAKSAQAINEAIGPYGLVPSILVFGDLPKLPKISSQKFPQQKERLRAA